MGIISNIYKKKFVCRYDREVGVPYYSYLDFPSLKQEENTFINSKGIEIHYFYYNYGNYKKDKIILFLPGIGPGHTAYLKEIESFAKRGFRVLSLDYTGCDSSKGECLRSLNTPTNDVNELLDYLNIKEEVVLVGHSLGGYTSLNIINLRKEINKAVILSGFLNVESLIKGQVKSKFILSRILNYERKTFPSFYDLDNLAYLKTTSDKLMFIQSVDDPIVSYDSSFKVVESLDNKNIETISLTDRGHNPNYTSRAVKYLNETFAKFNQLIKEKKIKTDEDKINYFKDVSLNKLVEQDEALLDQIKEFVEK